MPNAVYTSAEELAHPKVHVEKADGRQFYSNSKLSNVLWSYALNRRLRATSSKGKNWTVTAFDPGLMPGTGLARDAPPALRFIWLSILPRLIWLLRLLLSPNVHTDVESGFALARLGVGEDVQGKTGVYYEGLKEIGSSVDSRDVGKQEELWEWTVKAVARDEGERRAFEEV